MHGDTKLLPIKGISAGFILDYHSMYKSPFVKRLVRLTT